MRLNCVKMMQRWPSARSLCSSSAWMQTPSAIGPALPLSASTELAPSVVVYRTKGSTRRDWLKLASCRAGLCSSRESKTYHCNQLSTISLNQLLRGEETLHARKRFPHNTLRFFTRVQYKTLGGRVPPQEVIAVIVFRTKSRAGSCYSVASRHMHQMSAHNPSFFFICCSLLQKRSICRTEVPWC